MATPVILYTSAGMPIGARAVISFYRPVAISDGLTPANQIAEVMAAGTLTNSVGAFVIEDLTLDLTGGLVERHGIYGEDTDKAVVRKSPTLNLTAQMASSGTPTLAPGDYCEINIGMKITSTAGSPVPVATSRWFLDGNSISMNQNQANKFALKLQFDRQNSGAITEW
jgi:hypothetical protein